MLKKAIDDLTAMSTMTYFISDGNTSGTYTIAQVAVILSDSDQIEE